MFLSVLEPLRKPATLVRRRAVPPSHHRVLGRVYLVTGCDTEPDTDPRFDYFEVDDLLVGTEWSDYFGPVCMEGIHKFITLLKSKLQGSDPDRLIGMRTSVDDPELMTNAAFLLGAYMIIEGEFKPLEVSTRFSDLKFLSYTDALGNADFGLLLIDCWEALYRAKQLKWIDRGLQGFEADKYAQYADPGTYDMHEVVPGKLVAFRSPKSNPEHENMVRPSPESYAEALQKRFGVQAVIRLSTPKYNPEVIKGAGMGFLDLYFDDMECPPADVVAKFISIAEGLPGAIGIHCDAGLGRTGTLICLYMMLHNGFSARQAIGWARIVRPGSVLGKQQQYLVERQDFALRCAERYRGPVPSLRDPDRGVAAVQQLMDTVCLITETRLHKARTVIRMRSLNEIDMDANRRCSDAGPGRSELSPKLPPPVNDHGTVTAAGPGSDGARPPFANAGPRRASS